jgi:hypothetical protein
MEILRSPYTLTMEKDAMNLKISSELIEPGIVTWPVYEANDAYYLQNIFEFRVPKGVNVVKISFDVYQGLIVVSNCTITNEFRNKIWLKTPKNSSPVYIYVGVTQNCTYRLKVDDMTMINYKRGNLKFEWSYRINQVEPSVIDYME